MESTNCVTSLRKKITFLSLLFVLAFAPSQISAQDDDEELPPRPTVQPTATPVPPTAVPVPPIATPVPPTEVPVPSTSSASIQLWPEPALPGLWTVVQWQGGDGKWHDVEGWIGGLNRGHYVSWKVTASHFGRGPYRWVVYDEGGGGGERVGVSKTFNLPSERKEVVKITVQLQLERATMRLLPSPPQPNVWTEVQWIDDNNVWHPVEAWRGPLNEPYTVSWTVLPTEYGKGPFRWVVYDGEGGGTLAISSWFFLPSHNKQILHVNISLAPDEIQYIDGVQ